VLLLRPILKDAQRHELDHTGDDAKHHLDRNIAGYDDSDETGPKNDVGKELEHA